MAKKPPRVWEPYELGLPDLRHPDDEEDEIGTQLTPEPAEPAQPVEGQRLGLKRRLELRAGVKFSDADFLHLEEIMKLCLHYDPETEARYRHSIPLFMAPDMRLATPQARRARLLRSLVAMVEMVWRDSGGRGAGTWFDKKDPAKNGALVRLLQQLFLEAGVSEGDAPDARTLRRVITAVRNQDTDTTN